MLSIIFLRISIGRIIIYLYLLTVKSTIQSLFLMNSITQGIELNPRDSSYLHAQASAGLCIRRTLSLNSVIL